MKNVWKDASITFEEKATPSFYGVSFKEDVIEPIATVIVIGVVAVYWCFAKFPPTRFLLICVTVLYLNLFYYQRALYRFKKLLRNQKPDPEWVKEALTRFEKQHKETAPQWYASAVNSLAKSYIGDKNETST